MESIYFLINVSRLIVSNSFSVLFQRKSFEKALLFFYCVIIRII